MWTKEIKDLRLSENILSQEALAMDDFKKNYLWNDLEDEEDFF